MRRSLVMTVICVVTWSGFAGCGSRDDPWNRAPVEGEVTLDGELLNTGMITFFPIEGTKGPAAGATITDGRYSIDRAHGPVAGVNRVEIRSVQKTGRMVRSPEAPLSDSVPEEGQLVEEFADLAPRRYNSESILKYEIEAETLNQIDIELNSD